MLGQVLEKKSDSYPSQVYQDENLKNLANCIRVLAIDAVEKAKSGHPGMPLGMADVMTVLFAEILNFMPHDAKWLNRDRLILSSGHGAMLLYALLYLTGYTDISLEDLKNFRQLHSKTSGHPEYGLLSGIETSAGPLGQGLANAVGMAIASKIHSSKLGCKDILDHKVYAVVGDGCLMEGISHESCSLAGHLQLDNLIVIYDSNDITIDGSRCLADSDDVPLRFQAYGWRVKEIDGHNFSEIRTALHDAVKSTVPFLLICKTKIAYGAPTKECKSSSHGSPLGASEAEAAKIKYGWPKDSSFFIPDELLKIWRTAIGQRSAKKYSAWQTLRQSLSDDQNAILNSLIKLPDNDLVLQNAIAKLKKGENEIKAEASRESSAKILQMLSEFLPLLGGSADLTESNFTKNFAFSSISASNFSGNYIHYGIREHGMAAIMNGLALYGGIIPYGGTFLAFMDYAKPALKLAALMGLQVIYVMTHDSIGVGEDGATHQPVEQLSYLRSIPNVHVFRPADNIETAECWEMMMKTKKGPSVLCLTRQKIPNLRSGLEAQNFCSKGAYIISESNAGLPFKVTIFATGSEVSIALKAQEQLQLNGIGVRVVSVPCFALFDAQDEGYKSLLLDNDSVKIAVEAGVRFGWDKYIGKNGLFIGMDSFGASAPAADLYEKFGINVERIVGVLSAVAPLQKKNDVKVK